MSVIPGSNGAVAINRGVLDVVVIAGANATHDIQVAVVGNVAGAIASVSKAGAVGRPTTNRPRSAVVNWSVLDVIVVTTAVGPAHNVEIAVVGDGTKFIAIVRETGSSRPAANGTVTIDWGVLD